MQPRPMRYSRFPDEWYVLQQQKQSAASGAKQQVSNHFRNRMRMNDQPRITHHSGHNIAGNNDRFTQTGGETGAEQPQEDRPEGRRERGMAAKAGVVQLANPRPQPIKASLEAQTMAPIDTEQQTPRPRQQPRRFTQHQDNKQRR